jgi:hypothetical protein
MDTACSPHWREKINGCKALLENLKERTTFQNLGIDGSVISSCITFSRYITILKAK